MPDMRSSACAATTRTWVALDVHKDSITAGILSADGRRPEVVRLENTERALRRLVRRLGSVGELAVCYEAGPCGYDLYRLLVRAWHRLRRRSRPRSRRCALATASRPTAATP